MNARRHSVIGTPSIGAVVLVPRFSTPSIGAEITTNSTPSIGAEWVCHNQHTLYWCWMGRGHLARSRRNTEGTAPKTILSKGASARQVGTPHWTGNSEGKSKGKESPKGETVEERRDRGRKDHRKWEDHELC
ncbi:hypothetical protein N7541_007143 [Penicillium brevicompactum]|uniref:Uncharacterized protein n=2 Tax=Penicillium brevicompactum TaxID=5074 RepID=A0A9W9QWJ6_PENBR|nr:hypothetical protein N7541_007143 [Penicillium brevicompactum]